MATLFNVPVKRMLVIVLVLLLGCKDSDKNSSLIFEELNESLERSNKAIDAIKMTYLNDLNSKSKQPQTFELAKRWMPKSDSVLSITKRVVDFIESLKTDLRGKSGYMNVNGKTSINDNSQKTVSSLFADGKQLNELSEKLKSFEVEILKVDSSIKAEFENKVKTAFILNEFERDFFSKSTVLECYALLSKFLNDIKLLENEIVAYCDNHVVDNSFWYYKEIPLLTQNSSYFKQGDELRITAAVGIVRDDFDFRLSVDGKAINHEGDNTAIYSITIADKPGTYSLPVSIEYVDRFGNKQKQIENIKYTVLK